MSKKLLHIVPRAFHSKSDNAGAKTVWYYASQFSVDPRFEYTVCFLGDNSPDASIMQKKFPNTSFFAPSKKEVTTKVKDFFLFKCLYPILKLFSVRYFITNEFWDRRLRQVLKTLPENYQPDIILVEFTQIILFVDSIKKLFPTSKLVASSHDVTFLSLERKLTGSDLFSKSYKKRFKAIELGSLCKFDLIATHSEKDLSLIKRNWDVTTKAMSIAPYYDTYYLTEESERRHIFFFGSMHRPENYEAVIWFIENVWQRLNEYFNARVKFFIIGGGIPAKVSGQISKIENVEQLGFVEDPSIWFSKSFCTVVPLQTGAGIKIKVIESMASGIPVVANHIGIEGIDAINGFDYLHSETADSFFKNITELFNNLDMQESLIKNAKAKIKLQFNLKGSYLEYTDAIIKL